MTFRRTVMLLTVLCLVAFGYVARQISLISVGLAAHDQVERELRSSLDDQKKLARLDPGAERAYRQRFENVRELMGHLHVLALNRQAITRRIELVLLVILALILTGAATVFLSERSRMAAEHARRMRYLEHLTSWQEAARRHAHEIRTPLTAARMEIERLVTAARRHAPDAELAEARASVLEELDRLRQFTKNFTSFASVQKPQPRVIDLDRMIDDFCRTFATAWPSLRVTHAGTAGGAVRADSEMLRQVLVNLCNNSVLAGATTVVLHLDRNGAAARLDVVDDGAGIAPEIRGRLFEPYATTRPIGEGMGLGLAISKKILLDHGGDLEHVAAPRGATFRLTLPLETAS